MKGRAQGSRDARLDTSPYNVAVLSKAAAILSVFTAARPSLGLQEIAAATHLPKTTVFRILSTLVAHDLCELDAESGEYSLGFGLLRLAEIRRRQANLHQVAMPLMRGLRDAVNETVVLSVRTGDARVHIDFVESLHPVRRTVEIGVVAPLYAGAASKVLLAGMQDDEIDGYLQRTPLKKLQDSTITDRKALLAEIRLIRERGFAESRGELIAGGGALAAPLKDFSGRTVGVIDVLTPEDRYTPQHREKCIALLLEASRRGSERLGQRPPG